jgi:glycosyltransferase involved in cell wall biosynthesis/thymidylate kinase
MDAAQTTGEFGTSPPPRIAYVTSRFPKLTETFILAEILELQRQGVDVEVFALVREREAVVHPEAEALVARAHYAPFFSREVLRSQAYWLRRRPRAYLAAWARALAGNAVSPKFLLRALAVVPQAALFAQQAEALGVTHVHAHWATHSALSAYVIARLTGLPFSVTAHAHDIYVNRTMLREKMAAARFIVTVTAFNKQFLEQRCGAAVGAKTVVIRNGIDLSVFNARQQKGSNPTFTILCVASLKGYKGHRYLIDACAELRDRGLPFRCLCVGEGEERPALERQISRLGLAGCVSLLGHQPRQQVAHFLSTADVLAMPSVVTPSGKMEGLPVAVQEALAIGVPVVATSISGIPELVEHEQTGLLVPQRDAHQLADALHRLHDDPDLAKRLASAGCNRILREFDIHQTVASLRRLLLHECEPGISDSPAQRKSGISVALLGPDGAGKSTLAASLAAESRLPVKCLYMGWPQNSPGRARFRLKGAAWTSRALRLWWRSTVGWGYRVRGYLVIFDRYTFDALLPAGAPRRRARRIAGWCLVHCCPSPDLVFVLDVPGDVMFARKGEHRPEFLELQRRGFRLLSQQLPNAISIDATQGPDAVCREVMDHIAQRAAVGRAGMTKSGSTGDQRKGSGAETLQRHRVGMLNFVRRDTFERR